MLLTVSVIDIRLYRLPDRIVLPTLVASIVSSWSSPCGPRHPSRSATRWPACSIYFGFLFVVHLISPAGHGLRGREAGGGDGPLRRVGWRPSYAGAVSLVLWAMLIGFVAGSIVGIVLLVRRRRSTPIPFGPFLALGAITVVLIGQNLVSITLAA